MQLKLFTISPNTTIHKAIEKIDINGEECVIVIDKNRKVLGTVTDGDIRRAILKSVDLGRRVKSIMNAKPKLIREGLAPSKALSILKANSIRQLPVVNTKNQLVDIIFLDDFFPQGLQASAVIMAGGLGTRLRPFTDDTPKPLLTVGDKPILQTIVEQLKEHNITRIYISVNYKAKQIENYFKNGEKFGVEIKYLRETKKMGTAGALSLLPKTLQEPILVLNADLLTRVSFRGLLDFHVQGNFDVTLAIKEYDYQVPFGVVALSQNHTVVDIDEKPIHRFYVNAGIYAFSPSMLAGIRRNQYMDTTALIGKLFKKGKKVGAFPIREYWLDIGIKEDYLKANEEYNRHFNLKR